MKLTISNVAVNRHSEYSSFSLSCECNGARYHVWLDGNTRGLDQRILFKNSVQDRGKPGHFDCRKLSVDTKFNAELIQKMFEKANAELLFDKANQKLSDERKMEEEARSKKIADNLIREAAPDLIAALEKVREDINWMLNEQKFLSADVFNYLDIAIKKAKGEGA